MPSSSPEPPPAGTRSDPGTAGASERSVPWSSRPGFRLDPLTLSLLGLLVLLYVPFAGNYGLWDPWETHYGEVAHQMIERNDWISLWWPGSPNDRVSFWSKPVLTFWLMAASMKLFGLGHPGPAHAGEMTAGWTAEWALRLPGVLLGILGVWAVYHLVRRVAGRGAALWAGLILGTSCQWALISRQAMTDMPFVTPMTVALAFAGLALLLPAEEVQAPLPRRTLALGGLRVDYPADGAFYLFLGAYLLCGLPQLLIYLLQMGTWTLNLPGHSYHVHGLVAVLPCVALYLGALLWALRAPDRRSIYLWIAYIGAGLANLAKGPAGLALPALTVATFLLLSGRLRDVLGRRRERPWWWARVLPRPLRFLGEHEGGLELVRGGLIFLAIGAPWYALMVVRHGLPFWMELVGDNYVNRAQGRHGDRGTFEYYLRQLGAGLFPWSGVVAAAALTAGRWLRQAASSPRRQLALFCLSWFLVDFIIVSLVATKFHHYILPALPALAVLGGLLLDEICDPEVRSAALRPAAIALLAVGLPLTWLSGRDLSSFPARIGWLFNYDYVNMPGTGRPWPLTSIYGQRYEYGDQVLVLVIIALAAQVALAALLFWRGDAPVAAPEPAAPSRWPGRVLALGVLLAGAVLVAPAADVVSTWSSSQLPKDTVLPPRLRWGYLVPALGCALWLAGAFRAEAAGRRAGLFRAAAAVALSAVLWNCWVLDRFMIDLSPHWSQKSVFATYYKMRKGPEEPVVVWYLFWRGENFYTRNAIYDHRLAPEDKTVFEKDNDTEKMKAYFQRHRGQRIFIVCERGRIDRLRGLLPAEAQGSLQVVDHSNNKLALAVAQL